MLTIDQLIAELQRWKEEGVEGNNLVEAFFEMKGIWFTLDFIRVRVRK